MPEFNPNLEHSEFMPKLNLEHFQIWRWQQLRNSMKVYFWRGTVRASWCVCALCAPRLPGSDRVSVLAHFWPRLNQLKSIINKTAMLTSLKAFRSFRTRERGNTRWTLAPGVLVWRKGREIKVTSFLELQKSVVILTTCVCSLWGLFSFHQVFTINTILFNPGHWFAFLV
jgi:hypothetical protein